MKETEETKRKELESYQNSIKIIERLAQKIERKKESLERLEARITRTTQTLSPVRVQGGTPKDMGTLIAHKMDLEKQITITEQRLADKEKEKDEAYIAVTEEIDKVKAPKIHSVLDAYYLDGLDFWDIAQELQVSERTVQRRLAKGIEYLAGL